MLSFIDFAKHKRLITVCLHRLISVVIEVFLLQQCVTFLNCLLGAAHQLHWHEYILLEIKVC